MVTALGWLPGDPSVARVLVGGLALGGGFVAAAFALRLREWRRERLRLTRAALRPGRR